MSGWVRHEPLVDKAGDVGGDAQMSEAYAARWSRLLPGDLHAVVTRSFYVTSCHGGGIECDTEFAVCRDVRRPGDTELWSAGSVTHWSYRTDEASARQAAGSAPEPTDAEWVEAAPMWAVA